MSRAKLVVMAPLAAVLVSALGWSSPEPKPLVGPPWISMEIPANPLDPSTRGAAFVIHAFHHATPTGIPIVGTAEGLVNGERRSVELGFRKTDRRGVYALDQQWPAEGAWVLAITTAARSDLNLLIELGPEGGVREAMYYEWPINQVAIRSARVLQGGVDSGEIDRMLRRMARTTD